MYPFLFLLLSLFLSAFGLRVNENSFLQEGDADDGKLSPQTLCQDECDVNGNS